jgi:thiol-disulfide isomerase/thioredoxin
MMQKKFSLLLLLPWLALPAMAQRSVRPLPPQELRIGDPAPDLVMKVVNAKRPTWHLSEFKDRLVILDFWSVHCSGCVAALPHMEALQQAFGDSVRIIPVTEEPASEVVPFLKRNLHTRDLNLVSVVEDKKLSRLFPHIGVPHEAWLYHDTVVAITDADFVKAANLRFILSGRRNGWPVKNDFLTPVDRNKPFLQVDSVQYPDRREPIRYKALFGFREGSGLGPNQGSVYDSIRHTRRLFFLNNTILGAYFTYWQKLRGYSASGAFPDPNRIVLEVKDPSRFESIQETKDYMITWKQKHLFCYESVFPDSGASDVRKEAARVLADLDDLLGMHGRYETRRMTCLVLVRTGAEEKFRADTTGKAVPGHLEAPERRLRRSSMANLVWLLNQQKTNPPVFDGTGYAGKIDLDLPAGVLTDIGALRKTLRSYGLDLQPQERDVELFILTQK